MLCESRKKKEVVSGPSQMELEVGMESENSYILVDFENVQIKPELLDIFQKTHFRIVMFFGPHQKVLSKKYEHAATCVVARKSGKNAVDFHITYYIGKLSEKEPGAGFYILSRDTGYDPLIAYLHGVGIQASRFEDIFNIPGVLEMQQKALRAKRKAAKPKVPDKDIARAVQILSKIDDNILPKKIKPLSNMINSFFQNNLSEDRQAEVIRKLMAHRYICVRGQKVSYSLPRMA